MTGYGFASPTVATGRLVQDPAAYPLYHILNSDDMVPRMGALLHLGLCLEYPADDDFRERCYDLSPLPADVAARLALAPYQRAMVNTPSILLYSTAFLQCMAEEKGEEGLNSLLEALDFPASSSYTYQGTDGELVVRNGYDTLRVSAQGTVRYHTTEGEISRYPVASDTGGTGCYEAVEACRVLVSETLGTQCGAARLVLTHVAVSYTHLTLPTIA